VRYDTKAQEYVPMHPYPFDGAQVGYSVRKNGEDVECYEFASRRVLTNIVKSIGDRQQGAFTQQTQTGATTRRLMWTQYKRYLCTKLEGMDPAEYTTIGTTKACEYFFTKEGFSMEKAKKYTKVALEQIKGTYT